MISRMVNWTQSLCLDISPGIGAALTQREEGPISEGRPVDMRQAQTRSASGLTESASCRACPPAPVAARPLHNDNNVIRMETGPIVSVPLDALEKEGRKQLATGNVRGAIDCFTTYIGQAPDEVRGYLLRGGTYLRQGHYALAAADFTLAIAINPNDHRPWAGRGEAYRLAGDLGRAVHDLGIAAFYGGFEWNGDQICIALGLALWKLGDLHGADTAFSDAIAKRQDDPLTWALRACVRTAGQDARANDDFAQAKRRCEERARENPAWRRYEEPLSLSACMNGDVEPTYRLCNIHLW